MLCKGYDVFVRTNIDIYRLTERILSSFGKIIIQYDGVALSMTSRDLSKDIHVANKYLVSNMDWRRFIGKRPENFRQILLGIDESLCPKPDYQKKEIDLLAIGSLNYETFSKRCECIDYLLDHYDVKLFGSYRKNPAYKHLNNVDVHPILGRDFIETMKKSKLTVNIPSDDHLKLGSGMPMRLYENAAFGVMQLIYKTNALENTGFKQGRDFIFFKNREDMIEKVHYYLENDNERVKIAKNAYNTFIKYYTAQKSFYSLLQTL